MLEEIHTYNTIHQKESIYLEQGTTRYMQHIPIVKLGFSSLRFGVACILSQGYIIFKNLSCVFGLTTLWPNFLQEMGGIHN